jgi:ferritin
MATISAKMALLLSEQANRELYNSNFYLVIYNYFMEQNLNGIARHFARQVEEEREHNKKFIDYITSRTGQVSHSAIPDPDFHMPYLTEDPKHFLDVMKAYVALEEKTTAEIIKLSQEALNLGDMQTFVFLQELIQIQTVEEEEAQTYLVKAQVFGGSVFGIYMWNEEFHEK